MTDKELLGENFRCPSCFLNWFDANAKQIEIPSDKLCEFCEKPHSSLELLKRQVDIMHTAYPSDLPKFLRHLLSHLDLKP